MAQELDTTQAGVDGTPNGEAAATAGQGQERQPVDLTKLPEFRSWQSERDRRDAYMQQQLQQEALARQNLEAQFHQVRMEGLDETGKLSYQNQLLQNQLNEVARQRELDQYAFTRQRDLEEISTKTGVPFNELSQFNNVHEAWRYAVDKAPVTRSGKPAKVIEDAETPDPVDLGAGKHVDAATKLYTEWKKAKNTDFDMAAMWTLEEKAIAAGVDTNKWK